MLLRRIGQFYLIIISVFIPQLACCFQVNSGSIVYKNFVLPPFCVRSPRLKHYFRRRRATVLLSLWGNKEAADAKGVELEKDNELSSENELWSFMPDQSKFLKAGNNSNEAKNEFFDEVKASEQGRSGNLKAAFLIASISAVVYSLTGQPDSFPMNVMFGAENLFADPTSTLENIVSQVETMGTLGFLYFGIFYTIAEILAIPAFPLTCSAGYLFGLQGGTAIVLLSASIAASISFLIGRTALRSYVEGLLEKYPKFKAMDKAIGKEGFKLILLLRLSPLFPFALSNYLYGVTSVRFVEYFWGTLLGFLPGTMAYVYSGDVGKALTLDNGNAQPWYVYAAGLAVIGGTLKVASDVAAKAVEGLDDFDEE
mmetsp:Transcript_28832/g.44822  ORF Transcript_28832/g.44822 Transcript_28832/m.44822 type:complete len:369 (-) Transcript_28832:32-1138(-)